MKRILFAIGVLIMSVAQSATVYNYFANPWSIAETFSAPVTFTPTSGVPVTINGVSGSNVLQIVQAAGATATVNTVATGAQAVYYRANLNGGIGQIVFGVNGTGSTDAFGIPTNTAAFATPNGIPFSIVTNNAVGFTQGSTANPTYTFAGTGAISGVGSGLTSLNASNISSGTIAAARLPILSGTSASIGGGALIAGQCATTTTTVTGATTSMVALIDPNTYPGDGTIWDAQVTSANTVTSKVCAIIALTPNASTYNIRVIP